MPQRGGSNKKKGRRNTPGLKNAAGRGSNTSPPSPTASSVSTNESPSDRDAAPVKSLFNSGSSQQKGKIEEDLDSHHSDDFDALIQETGEREDGEDESILDEEIFSSQDFPGPTLDTDLISLQDILDSEDQIDECSSPIQKLWESRATVLNALLLFLLGVHHLSDYAPTKETALLVVVGIAVLVYVFQKLWENGMTLLRFWWTTALLLFLLRVHLSYQVLMKYPTLLLVLGIAIQKLWENGITKLRFWWTTSLLLFLLGAHLSKQAQIEHSTLLLVLRIALLVDVLDKLGPLQLWKRYQSDDVDDGDHWTPSAQSKSGSFWQVLLRAGKRNVGFSKNSTYKQRPFKDGVYVLECQRGKYYVGSTSNLKRRIQEHFDGSGSEWTKIHKPIRVLRVYRRVPYRYKLGFESQVTAELMCEKGINNVRGSMFLYSKEFSYRDLDSLVGFIGHYNELSFHSIRRRLSKELQGDESRLTDNSKSKREESIKHFQKEYMKKKHAKGRVD